MPTPWIDSVRGARQLSVHMDAPLSRFNWNGVVTNGIREFNRLSRHHHLGVTLTATSDSNANVSVNTANGSASFSYDGGSHSVALPGHSLQGSTSNLSRDGRLFKSHLFLPVSPMINTPRGRRPVGDGVKLVIAVHEFIHCCGLNNSEHSSDDIFTGYPSVDYGRTPGQDKVEIRVLRRRRTAPPLFLGGTTVRNVRGLWR